MQDQIVVVRNSELSTYRQCRQKWDWGWNQGFQTKRPRSALDFGNLIHNVMELFYVPGLKRGGKPHLIWWDVWADFLESGSEDWEIIKDVQASELGFQMCSEYWKQYGDDTLFEVIAPEMAFEVDIVDPDSGEDIGIFTGQMDVVVRNRETKQIGLLEHKTGASLDPFGAPLSMDEQASTYWALGPIFLHHIGVLNEKEDLDFILYNRLRKAMPDFRPKDQLGNCLNKNGTISSRQPTPLFKREYTWRNRDDRGSLIRRVTAQMRELKKVKAGELEIYKNPDKHCGYCEFKDICEVHESGSDWQVLMASTMGKWDPYEAHNHNLEGEIEWL